LPDKAHHFSLIGQVAAITGTIEQYLSIIFGVLLGQADQSDASIIFSHLESFERRIEVVHALIERRYRHSSTTLERWRNLRKKIKQFQSDRNHVLHGINLQDIDGRLTLSSPFFHQLVKLHGLKSKHARDRNMTTENLYSCVQDGSSLLTEAHRFFLHLTGQEHLLETERQEQA
jgi:hypothetical protein